MNKIIAFISHPISGDVAGNITKILAICRNISLNEPQVVPFVPYLADLLSLDDTKPKERTIGIQHSTELFTRQIIGEVRLYGPRISPEMWSEINLAESLKIPVHPMTKATTTEFINNRGF